MLNVFILNSNVLIPSFVCIVKFLSFLIFVFFWDVFSGQIYEDFQFPDIDQYL